MNPRHLPSEKTMEAEFSHLFKEENYIKNTSLVHTFNSGEARLGRTKRDESAEILSPLAFLTVSTGC